jgi:hypothetical protein
MENAVYEKVGKMVKAEILTNFEEIAAQTGKHKLCASMGMAFETLAARIGRPGSWRVACCSSRWQIKQSLKRKGKSRLCPTG